MDSAASPAQDKGFGQILIEGFRASALSILLIAAINTGIAAVLWIDDTRPFWHPFVTCQLYGFSIAYCVNVASPWGKPHAIARLARAVAIGALIGVALVIIVKGYDAAYVRLHWTTFAWNFFAAFLNGLFVSLFFYVKIRETLAEAALQRANAERHLLSRQATEAQLKLMQAQVEPHFLFNTLASVQYLTETDPPRAGKLLGHLIAYLRAALPQLRAASSTLGQEAQLIEAYLNILKMRMGERLAFEVAIPDDLRTEPFPPNLVISLVENAVRHGIEPTVQGGRIGVSAARDGESLVVRVTDTGSGVSGGTSPAAGQGVGLSNIRERLAALYGERARFTLASADNGGCVATISLPLAHR
ncbi:MAG TPA: histidine kinase [Casimicrobiaceae bacterium]|nr:histidine kinase [Casimicrobiaceae bacterium]